ncbi:MAG: SMI1/KNR4 family protein [Lachnospiraceae bacterium]|nr:SMI1/KNR4 family protein [Lachnospiraceae bacterium]
MFILNELSDLFKVVTSNIKSSDVEIDELIQFSKIDVPEEFIQIIKEKTELEIQVDDKKYIRIWGANGCIEMNAAYSVQKYIPNSLAIGDDECCNVILYASGHEGFGVYMVSLSDLDVDEMVFIANSLEDFFVKEKGLDAFNNRW